MFLPYLFDSVFSCGPLGISCGSRGCHMTQDYDPPPSPALDPSSIFFVSIKHNVKFIILLQEDPLYIILPFITHPYYRDCLIRCVSRGVFVGVTPFCGFSEWLMSKLWKNWLPAFTWQTNLTQNPHYYESPRRSRETAPPRLPFPIALSYSQHIIILFINVTFFACARN